MSARLIAVALVCATSIACGPPGPDGDGAVVRETIDVTDTAADEAAARYDAVPLEVYLREGALVAGLDRPGTRARLGTPDSVDAQATPNRHDPQITDSMVTLHYAGARYVFYVVTQGDRDLLDLAVISSDAHLRHAAPGIGTSADSVRALLGEPAAARPDALEYDCLTCEVPLPVTFQIEDDRVRAIRFDFYVD